MCAADARPFGPRSMVQKVLMKFKAPGHSAYLSHFMIRQGKKSQRGKVNSRAHWVQVAEKFGSK